MKKKKELTLSEVARMGGEATKKKYGRDHYRNIANKRHAKTKKAVK